jgi:hypothetical protein
MLDDFLTIEQRLASIRCGGIPEDMKPLIQIIIDQTPERESEDIEAWASRLAKSLGE